MHFKDADISQDDFRAWWRLGLDLYGIQLICTTGNLEDAKSEADEISVELPRGAKTVRGQTASPESLDAALAIMRGECE